MLLTVVVVFALGGCATTGSGGESMGAAPLRGFGVDVDAAIAAQVPTLHLKTCGSWGCHEQDVPLLVSGPTSAMPCPSGPAPSDVACGIVHLPGSGPGYGYAPVPALTLEPVTVTVTTPPGAAFRVNADVRVRPTAVCPGEPGRPPGVAAPKPGTSCAGAAPQARLRIAADGTVSQSR